MKRLALLVVLVVVGGVGAMALAGPWINGEVNYIPVTTVSTSESGYSLSVSASLAAVTSSLGFGIPLSPTVEADVYTGFSVATLSLDFRVDDPWGWESYDTGWMSFPMEGWFMGTDIRWQQGENFLKLGVEYAPPTVVVLKLKFFYEFELPSSANKPAKPSPSI